MPLCLCCPSSRCSSRCCWRSRSNGRALRRRDRREWRSWPKSSLASNLLPGWRKTVSYTVCKDERITHTAKTCGWLKEPQPCSASRLQCHGLFQCGTHNEFKLEAEKNVEAGKHSGKKMHQGQAQRGWLNNISHTYFCSCDSSSSRETHFS